ncbi:hypothetical protein MPER_11792, partial [Moniliophthora perniciosa FA553]
MDPQVLQLFEDAKTMGYIAVAAVTLLVLDYFLTLGQEACSILLFTSYLYIDLGIQIELVWKGPKGLASILFIISRYFGAVILGISVGGVCCFTGSTVLTHLIACSDASCFSIVGDAVLVTTVDLVLFLSAYARVWVLYNRSRTILYFLLPLLIGEMIVTSVSYPLEKNGPYNYLSAFKACLVLYDNNIFK